MKWKVPLALGIIALIGGSFWFFNQPKPEPPQTLLGSTGSQSIRQEINITDAYFYAAASTYATSSEIIAVTDNNYTTPKYYFEVVASTTGATTGTIDLVNATSSKVVATITMTGGQTSYARLRSTQFIPNASTTVEYKVRLNNEAIGKGILASRVVILQDTSSLTNTETQIEIGSATTTANNTTTLPLKDPKYWTYSVSKWDASPTFYVEATYKNTAVASSTTYNVSATTTATFYNYVGSTGVGYVVAEGWGGGGGGNGQADAATTGGGGGGGGTYARATTTVAAGSSNVIGVGRGGAEGTAKAVTASSTLTTASGLVMAAEGGEGSTSGTGAATSTLAASVGGVITAGGKGGNGDTNVDTGGGGGGAAGPDGFGISGGLAANGGPGGAGGAGNKALGGAGGAAGNGADDTCNTENGGMGVNNVLGAGGGGGADGDVTSICLGGNGGRPGGGGGGSDEGPNTSSLGGPGQVKITEWIGTTGIALQEDDGNFGSWTFKAQIATTTLNSTTTQRARSAAFTPTDGRHYRIVASTTQSGASYDIYNAKIVVVQQENPGGTIVDSQTSSGTNDLIRGGNSGSGETGQMAGQSFTPSGDYIIGGVKLSLWKVSSPTDNLYVELATDSFSGTTVATSDQPSLGGLGTTGPGTEITFTFSAPYGLTGGVKYFLRIIRTSGTYDATNYWNVAKATSNTYAGGNSATRSNNVWNEQSASFDQYFKTFTATTSPTLLEPQYLLAPFKLPAGTSLQNMLSYYDPADWLLNVNYLIEADAASGSGSDIFIKSSDGLTTYATLNNPNNVGTTTFTCLPVSATTWDTLANTNGADVYSVRVLAQVGGTQTSVCSSGPAPSIPRVILQSQTIIQSQVIIQ